MATAIDLINAALTEIGVRAVGETLPSGEAVDALTTLNGLLDQWAADNLTIYAVTRTTATLTPSLASFSIGQSGSANIVMARPVFIERVSFLDTNVTPNTEYPIGDLMTEEEYARIPLKTLTSPFPQAAYYSPTFPDGTLKPWPIPTMTGLQWVIYAWTAVPQIAALATTVALPPAYYRMLVKNLALDLCSSYRRQPHPVLVKAASDSMATVKRANIRPTDMTFGADVLGSRGGSGPGGWNIRIGP